MRRFFIAVDRAIVTHIGNRDTVPLVLAALPENQSIFRAVTHNKDLLDAGVATDPNSLNEDGLRSMAWACFEPAYQARVEAKVNDYRTARSRGLGTDDLAEAARAVRDGRIGVLLAEADRVVPGTIDAAAGEFRPGDLAAPDVDDALDDLAEHVLRTGGTVLVLPRDRMPTGTGLAAIFRF